jgi:hypothetical protein
VRSRPKHAGFYGNAIPSVGRRSAFFDYDLRAPRPIYFGHETEKESMTSGRKSLSVGVLLADVLLLAIAFLLLKSSHNLRDREQNPAALRGAKK